MRRARQGAILAVSERGRTQRTGCCTSAAGKRHQRAGEGFHQCKLCPPGTPCPPPHARACTHTHTHSTSSQNRPAFLNSGAAPPLEREGGNSLSVSLSHTQMYSWVTGGEKFSNFLIQGSQSEVWRMQTPGPVRAQEQACSSRARGPAPGPPPCPPPAALSVHKACGAGCKVPLAPSALPIACSCCHVHPCLVQSSGPAGPCFTSCSGGSLWTASHV